ncbi:MAG: putative DNA binding domain-containing protein, partial [Burkholderiales bacterium]|nr:putative DNA binding domain-containing protein [Burkholderiales bacterium]
MTEQELLALLALDETDRVEFTEAVRDTDKFSEAVCAFANDLPNRGLPGYLIVGVNKRREPAGLKVTDELLRSLGGLRDNGNIQPLPVVSVEKIVLAAGEIAVVTVQPSLLPPVRYKGRVCIRNGPRKGYATEQEERILIERRVSHAKTFDALPCLDARLDDLALPLFLIDYRAQAVAAETIAENRRSVEHQLASLRFFDLGHNCPTHAGILLFGLDVRRWLPGAYIQFLRVAGDSLAAPIANDRELSGDLLTVLRELDALIDAQLAKFPVDESTL